MSPLLHGEINCIQQFLSPAGACPATKVCVFFATHEPCPLCLSGIAWSGFTYEDNRDVFSILPRDIDILQQVFRVPAPSDTQEKLAARPLYNRRNKFFVARSLAHLLGDMADESERMRWAGEIARIEELYGSLNSTSQDD